MAITYTIDPSGGGDFTSIVEARNYLRTDVLPSQSDDVIVYLRSGDYRVSSVISFGDSDSGNNGHSVTWTRYPGDAMPRILGSVNRGAPNTSWSVYSGSIYRIHIGTGFHPKVMWTEDGDLCWQARWPKRNPQNFDYITAIGRSSDTSFGYPSGAIPNVSYDGDLEVHGFPGGTPGKDFFRASTAQVSSLNEGSQIINLSVKFAWPHRMTNGDPFWIMGALEFLTEEGEMYHDSSSGYLYYWPVDASKEVEVPVVNRVFSIDGASDLHFRRLEFAFVNTSDDETEQSSDYPAVYMNNSSSCSFDSCLFHYIGVTNLKIKNSSNVNVRRCEFSEAGCTGLWLEDSSNSTVRNNRFYNCGVLSRDGTGYVSDELLNCVCEYNSFYGCPNYAWVVRCDYKWWTVRHTNPATDSPHRNNTYRYNYVENCGFDEIHRDTAVIYNMGSTYGTVVDHNIFCNCTKPNNANNETYSSMPTQPDWYGALYFDNMHFSATITNNIIYNIQNLSSNNPQCYACCIKGSDHIIDNNVWANLMLGLYFSAVVSSVEGFEYTSGDNNQLSRNIIYKVRNDETKVFDLWDDPNFHATGKGYDADRFNSQSGDNIWYSEGNTVYFVRYHAPGTWTLPQLQGDGKEIGSLSADPLFTDPDNGDFTFQAGSPAPGIGIDEIDTSNIGLEEDFPDWTEVVEVSATALVDTQTIDLNFYSLNDISIENGAPTNFRPKINSISATTTEGTGSLTTTLSASLTYPVGASISYEWRIGTQTFVSSSPTVALSGETHGYGYYNVYLKIQYTGTDGYDYWDLRVEPMLLKVNNSAASTYYFDNSGTTGAGTQANPWGRISELNTWQSGSAVDGDTLKILKGTTYTMDTTLNVYHPFHIETYGSGDRPTWNGGASSTIYAQSGLIKLSMNGIILRNFHTSPTYNIVPQMVNVHTEDVGRAFHWGGSNRLDPREGVRSGAAGHGISIPKHSYDACVKDCTVKNAHNSCIYFFGGYNVYVGNTDLDSGHDLIKDYMGWSDNQVKDLGPGSALNGACQVHDPPCKYIYFEGGSGKNSAEWTYSTMGGSSDDFQWIKFENVVVGFGYDASFLTQGTDVLWEKCIFHSSRTPPLARGRRTWFENCLFFGLKERYQMVGIQRASCHPDYEAREGLFCRFNTFVANSSNGLECRFLTFQDPDGGGAYTDVQVQGNIFVNLGSDGTRFIVNNGGFSPTHSSNSFEDNVYYAQSVLSHYYSSGTTYSTIGAWRTATGHDINSITSNPQLVGGDFHDGTADAYELQETSPARSLTSSNYHVHSDYNGVLYSDSDNDAGAIIHYTGSTDLTKIISEAFSLSTSSYSVYVISPTVPSRRKEVRKLLFGIKRFRRP